MTTTPILDTRSFPLVWLRPPARPLDTEEAKALIDGLIRLLDGERPYVIISEGGSPALPREAERSFALWFKSDRDRLARLCGGMAMVIPPGPAHDDAVRQVAKAAAAYPYPVAVIPDTDTAMAWAHSRLERTAPRS
ncbi:hypothetical protein ABMY26_08685 [Azospirillum sp. HJ39]|uniref:hypothetical protein n=1 Tax=Azospirillum sp. HJ39 TaxID=3159496 RepID=UPI003557DF46